MKRKIIKQSNRAYTVTLPINWIRSKKLEEGNEINVEESKGTLIIDAKDNHTTKQEIVIKIPKVTGTPARIFIVNAYRAGFDKIDLEYDGSEKELKLIIDRFMIGFEVFNKAENKYMIESVSEPSYDNLQNMVNVMFYTLNEVLSKLFIQDIEDDVHRIQKYDNFLKRCITKKMLNDDGNMFLWQFLSNLSQIGRVLYHFENNIKKNKNLSVKEYKKYFDILKKMIDILKTAYLKKDISGLEKLHDLNHKIYFAGENSMNKKSDNEKGIITHHIMLISRIIYLANSPLIGYLQMREFAGK